MNSRDWSYIFKQWKNNFILEEKKTKAKILLCTVHGKMCTEHCVFLIRLTVFLKLMKIADGLYCRFRIQGDYSNKSLYHNTYKNALHLSHFHLKSTYSELNNKSQSVIQILAKYMSCSSLLSRYTPYNLPHTVCSFQATQPLMTQLQYYNASTANYLLAAMNALLNSSGS